MQEINRKKTPSKVKPTESQLAKTLSQDKQLNEDKPRLQLFLSLANMFDEDLKVNLKLTSFELDEKYQTHSPHDWLAFKQYVPVRKYITAYLDEEQLSQAQRTLSTDGINKTSDAINIQSIIEGKQKADQNTNIIVFFMPQKKYLEDK